MEPVFRAEEMRIHKSMELSAAAAALDSDHPPELTVYFVPDTPQSRVDAVLKDLRRYAHKAELEPFYLESMDQWGVGLIPRDLEAGKALLDYCGRSQHAGGIAVVQESPRGHL